MKTSTKIKGTGIQKKSKIGQIKVLPSNQQKKVNSNKTSKTKTSFYSKATNTKKTAPAKDIKMKDQINLKLKPEPKDESIEIPKEALCLICHQLVKDPTKCYQCNALFCRGCILNMLEKYHKCPKCFKILSEDLIKTAVLTKEFENTFIKCKYIGCQDKINLINYEEHLNTCPFKNIKDQEEVEKLKYFKSLPFNEDPYSNSPLMNYSLQKIENDLKLDDNTSYIRPKEEIEDLFVKMKKNGEAQDNISQMFQMIIGHGTKLEDDILELTKKKEETNEKIKDMQKKIDLYHISS